MARKGRLLPLNHFNAYMLVPGQIYFYRGGDIVKIGWSRDAHKHVKRTEVCGRFDNRDGRIVRLIDPGHMDQEIWLHHHFVDKRIDGE